jgi:hypothetical protein
MKSNRIFILLTVVAILTSSCYKRNGWGVRGKGSAVTETRHADGFDRIQLSGDATVEYTQDSIYFLEVTGQANVLAVLKTEVKGGELKVFYERNVWDHSRVLVKVHSPKAIGFSVSGSGDILVQDSLKSDNLSSQVTGSGNLIIPKLKATSLSAAISGSGNLKILKGTVTTENFVVSGSGNLEALELLCAHNSSKVSGSGNISVNVSEDLNVEISGSGDVKYKGRPAITSEISGSGRLVHIN